VSELPQDWRRVTVEEIADVVGGGTPPTKDPENFGGPVPWLTPKDLSERPRRYTEAGKRWITEKGLASSGAQLLPKGAVLVSSRAPIGLVTIAKNAITTNQGFRSLVLRGDDVSEFLYYLLGALRPALEARANGTTFKEISGSELKGVELILPPASEQRAIADVLGALDNKIASNRRITDTTRALSAAVLAAADQTECRSVGDLVEFHNRRRVPLSAKQRAEMPGPYPYYGATGIFDHLGDYLFDERLLLVGEDGSVVNEDGTPVAQYVWGKCWVNNHAHVLTGSGVSTELAYLLISRADVRPSITGAVQAKLSMTNLKTVAVEVPSDADLPLIEAEIEPLFSRLRVASQETAALVALRDVLLSELLSGRRRVKDGENLAESLL
jgi:type I restriction enzyme, S subunit